MDDEYRQKMQEFFRVPDVSPNSIRENVAQAGLVPGLETPAQKKQKQSQKRKTELRKRIIQTLMATDNGREWLYDRLIETNVFGTPFNPDTHLTAYNCGALYVGRILEADIISFAPDGYSLMRKEALDRDRQAEEHLNENDAKAE